MVNVFTNGTITLLASLITSQMDINEHLTITNNSTPPELLSWHCFALDAECLHCDAMGGHMLCNSEYTIYEPTFKKNITSTCNCKPYIPYTYFKKLNDPTTEIKMIGAKRYEIFQMDECDALMETQYERFRCKSELNDNWKNEHRVEIQKYLDKRFQLDKLPVETSCYSAFRSDIHFMGSDNSLDYGYQLLFRIEAFDGEIEVYNTKIHHTQISLPFYRRLVTFPYRWSVTVPNEWGLGTFVIARDETDCIFYNTRTTVYIVAYFIFTLVGIFLIVFLSMRCRYWLRDYVRVQQS